jgi:predicted sulfurtransferase
VWPIPKPVIPEGFEACVECDEPTKKNCDHCGEPLCSGFLCSFQNGEGTVCACCHEEMDEEDE